jgi:hypothetical protein
VTAATANGSATDDVRAGSDENRMILIAGCRATESACAGERVVVAWHS